MQLADIWHPTNFEPPTPFGPGSKWPNPCERGDEADQSEDEMVSDIDEDEEVTFWSPQPHPVKDSVVSPQMTKDLMHIFGSIFLKISGTNFFF